MSLVLLYIMLLIYLFYLPKKKTEEDYEDNLEGNKTSEHDKIINNIFHSVPPHSSSKTLEKN